MTDEITLILALSAILIVSPLLAKIMHFPTTPIEILFGALFAYWGFIEENHLFSVVAEFGFLFLMFLAGAELDITKVFHKSSGLLEKSIFYLMILYGLSFLYAFYFDLSNVFIVILPLISIGLVATLSKEYGSHQPWVQLSFSVGSIGEVVSIGVLTIVSAFFESGFSSDTYAAIAYLIAFTLAIVFLFKVLDVIFWWFPEVKTYLMPYHDNKEQDIRIAIALLFGFIAIMLFLHLELAFGDFIAGIFLPTFFKHKEELPEKLSGFGFGFVIPIFFIHIGSTFNVQALWMDGLVAKALLIMALMVSMRLMGTLVFIKKLGWEQTLLLGLSHAMPLTLLIAVATLAYHSDSINLFHYYAFILAALFEVIVAMLGIKLIMYRLHRTKEKSMIRQKHQAD